MEWVLQVVDEFDDVVGALRLFWLGAAAEIPLVLAGGAGFGAIGAALVTGAEPLLMAAATIVLGLAGISKIRDSRSPAAP
jgi:hypothetical protein